MRRRTVLMVAVLAALVGALVAAPVAVYASHQFSDVPNTNPFHDDIDWLAEAEVTLGCGAGQYCPEDFVTREQMAAFMRRLAENRVVDAGELGGFGAANLAPRAAFNSKRLADTGDLTLSTEITAPADGLLIVTGHVSLGNAGREDGVGCSIFLDDVLTPVTTGDATLNGGTGINHGDDCELTGTVAVEAGEHTVDLRILSVGQGTQHTDTALWALWVPFDGDGNTP